MVKIAVVGSSEFTVGFQLAGIKNIIDAGSDAFSDLKGIRNRKEIGIVVVDQKIMERLDAHQKLEIESSVEPVFIPLSAKAEQNSLKRLIKKSIGVDLWK